MKEKVCCRCGVKKDLYQFSKRKGVKGGLGVLSYCKECVRIMSREASKTKNGVVNGMFFNQKSKSKNKGWAPPSYTLRELKNWVFSQDVFHELYDVWVCSGYDILKCPSGDRLDDYKPYSFDNLRIVSWEENKNRYIKDKKNGINTKDCTPILQFNLEGVFVSRYYSIAQAARVNNMLKSGIAHCCNGDFDTYKGYVWRHDI